MAKTAAERQAAYRARRQAREAAAAPAGERPPSLVLQGLRLGICHGENVYCVDLAPSEALSLALQLLKEIGVGIELIPREREAPRPLSTSTPISMIKPAGNA